MYVSGARDVSGARELKKNLKHKLFLALFYATFTLAHLNVSVNGRTGVSFFQQFFSRVLRDSKPRFVGPSVGPSVRHILLFRHLRGF